MPRQATPDYGIDFIVASINPTGGSADAVFLDPLDPTVPLPGSPPGDIAIDPDPVNLPDGTWRGFVGINTNSAGPRPLRGFVGTAEDGNADASAPWTLGPTSGVHWSA